MPNPIRTSSTPVQALIPLSAALLVCGAVQPLAAAVPEGWPSQRGPHNDGTLPPVSELPAQLPGDPRVVWRVDVGEGFAAPIVSAGVVVCGELAGGEETFRAWREGDGEVVWSHRVGASHRDGFGTGPRCAPAADGEVVLLQSTLGELHCLDLGSGELRWKKSFQGDFESPYIGERGQAQGAARHGYAASPLIDGAQVIALPGAPGASVVCLEKASGEVVWRSQDDIAAYAAPVVAELAGVRQVVCFTVEGLIGLRRDDGELLWRVPMETAYGRHVAAPVVHGDLVIAGSHEVGLVATRVVVRGGEFETEEAWRLGRELGPNFSSPVIANGCLILLAGKEVVCLDPDTGTVGWSEAGLVSSNASRAFAAFIGADERVLMLNDMGELILFAADAGAFRQLGGRAQACGKNWCHPAYADGAVVVRDARRLARLTLR